MKEKICDLMRLANELHASLRLYVSEKQTITITDCSTAFATENRQGKKKEDMFTDTEKKS